MSEPQIIIISPDDVRPAGQHRTGRTIGDLGMTTDVGSPCYPYKCTPTCQHTHKRAAQAATAPEGDQIPVCQDCGMRHAPDDKAACIEGHGEP